MDTTCAAHLYLSSAHEETKSRVSTLEEEMVESRLDRRDLHAKAEEGERMTAAILETQRDILKALEGLKGRPAKTWEKVKTVALTAVVTSIVAGLVGAGITFILK